MKLCVVLTLFQKNLTHHLKLPGNDLLCVIIEGFMCSFIASNLPAFICNLCHDLVFNNEKKSVHDP